jgi:predicted transcriptional regulator YdeE
MRDAIRLQHERHVIGLRVRTRNADEANPSTGRIGPLWTRFFQEDVAARISNRLADGPVMAVYSDYASDHHGEYSLTVGCEVTGLEEIPPGMAGITVAPATYAVFPVTGSGPGAIQEAWRHVWSAFGDASRGTRAYTADFEEYRFGAGGSAAVTLYIAVTQ